MQDNKKTLSEFKKLKFKRWDSHTPSRAKLFFDNWYWISVIKWYWSYTKKWQYEIAVLIGNEEQRDLCYSTEIADDVIWNLSPEEVEDYIIKIKTI